MNAATVSLPDLSLLSHAMLTIGIDPDLHDLAIGYWRDGKPYAADVIHVPKRKGKSQQFSVLDMVASIHTGMFRRTELVNAVAVEAQTLQRTGLRQHKRPQDIVVLGNVAGAVLARVMLCFSEAAVHFPTPEEWKGQIPKEVMQARLYDELGWGYDQKATYSAPLRIPPAFRHVSVGQWKHVGDALLLAKWASEQ